MALLYLPIDVSKLMLSYLDIVSICRVFQTCRRLSDLRSDSKFWKSLLLRDFNIFNVKTYYGGPFERPDFVSMSDVEKEDYHQKLLKFGERIFLHETDYMNKSTEEIFNLLANRFDDVVEYPINLLPTDPKIRYKRFYSSYLLRLVVSGGIDLLKENDQEYQEIKRKLEEREEYLRLKQKKISISTIKLKSEFCDSTFNPRFYELTDSESKYDSQLAAIEYGTISEGRKAIEEILRDNNINEPVTNGMLICIHKESIILKPYSLLFYLSEFTTELEIGVDMSRFQYVLPKTLRDYAKQRGWSSEDLEKMYKLPFKIVEPISPRRLRSPSPSRSSRSSSPRLSSGSNSPRFRYL